MKSRPLVISLTVVLAIVMGVNYSIAAYNPTLPVVSSCTASPATIPDAGGSLKITLHVIDPTPVNLVVVNVMNIDGGNIAFGQLTLTSGSTTDGDWSSTFSVAPNLKPGIYSVVAQDVLDTSQNQVTFYSSPNCQVAYGTFSDPSTALPSATPTTMPTNNTLDLVNQIGILRSQLSDAKNEINSLNRQLSTLNRVLSRYQTQIAAANSANMNPIAKLKKICSFKPKPKGCK